MKIRVQVSFNPRGGRVDPGTRVKKWLFGKTGVVDTNWKVRGRPTPWAQLSPATAAGKIRSGYSPVADQIRTGKLYRAAMNPDVQVKNPKYFFASIPRAQNKYAGYHQQGTSRMPARPPFAIVGNDAELIVNEMADDILSEFGI